MATLEEFKAMRDAVPMSVQGELFRLMTSDPDVSIRRMVEIAAEKGMTVSANEVRGFLSRWIRTMNSMTSSWMQWRWLPLLVAELMSPTAAKRKRMTSHGGVALACVR